jgi:hypothetical protein
MSVNNSKKLTNAVLAGAILADHPRPRTPGGADAAAKSNMSVGSSHESPNACATKYSPSRSPWAIQAWIFYVTGYHHSTRTLVLRA